MELYRLLDFFETVGLLVNRGYLDEEDVWSEFGHWILTLNALRCLYFLATTQGVHSMAIATWVAVAAMLLVGTEC